jgi:alpha-D-ribose 1-methylphosphonate 5-triphosphate synthase subunit PhnG
MTVHLHEDASVARRQRWVGLLAKADGATLRRLVDDWGAAPDYERLRGPEIGLVMLRGRAGGTGAAFNCGEMTVTRCSVRLPDGTLGHAYVGGRDPGHCETAAWLDALLQTPAHQGALLAEVIEPLARAADERRTLAARKAAATRVEFFTMATEAR